MGVLNWITQGCDALTATASPTIDALGVRMCIALATIMLVWFGVQESLASTHGGQGFHMGKFLSFFMMITFAYTLVRFYDSSIPGVGQSFRGFINGGAQYLVSVIGNDSITSIQNTLNQAQATSGPGMMKALMNPYYAIVYVIIQVLIATFSAVVCAIVDCSVCNVLSSAAFCLYCSFTTASFCCSASCAICATFNPARASRNFR